MDDPEQYLMQVLQRTRTGLQDSLIPYHASKMVRLAERLEQAQNLKEEIGRLERVNGFTKAALSMQWVMERVVRSGEDFNPDQFDVDATLVSDKLFEAFLSEPFDAPSEAAQSTQASASNDVEAPESEVRTETELPQEDPFSELVETSSRELHSGTPAPSAPFEEEAVEPPPPPPPAPVVEPPALADLLDQNLLLGFQRFTEIVSKLSEKTPSERKSVFAVLAMIAKSSTDVARAQGKKDVLEFFQSVLKFISYVDSSGSTQDSRVAAVMRDVGERLSKALTERSNGAELLQSIIEILKNPESSLKS
jgi:hypothetical protein